MKRQLHCLLFMLLAACQLALAQTIDVKGTVLDDIGEPLMGATVFVKSNPKQGTATDLDGNFQLKDVPTGDKIVVTYVGMKKVEMTPKPQMTIEMETLSEMLDGVIVTAFGSAKKSSFTGSAAVVNSDKIESKQVTNVMQSLLGEVPGLQVTPSTAPGATSEMLVRGAGSIYADTEPLVVVDGMPYAGTLNGINPSDVENITVLKDAASSALYGARGANGVILITTKKGSAGNSMVTFDARWGSNSRGSQIYDRITDPGQYYEVQYAALYNNLINTGVDEATAHARANANLTGAATNGGLGYNCYTVPDGQYLIGRNGRLNPQATLGNRIYVNGQYYTLMPDDWVEETYRTGFRQEYNLAVSGGNEKAQVYGSFGYLSNSGIIAGSKYERFSGKLRASYEVRKWLNFGANFGYTHDTNSYSFDLSDNGSESYTVGGVFSDAINIGAIYPLYVRDGNGNILYDQNGKVFDWGNGYYNTDGTNRPPLINASSLNSAMLDYYKTNGNNMVADGYLDISIPYGFKVTIKGGTNVYERRTMCGYNPYYGWSASYNGATDVAHARTTTFNFQQLINWSKSYGLNNLNVLLGHENYDYRYTHLEGYKENGVDYANNQELYGYLNFGTTPAWSYANNYNTEGWIFRGMYDYDDRYFGQVSFRRDASSRFHPKHRWGNFWSLGGAWIISREKWFTAQSWLNTLKFKVSYGQVGNDNIGDYRYVDTWQINNVGGDLSLSLLSKGNPDITWEKLANLNAGFEFELFNSRLSGMLEFYNKYNSDMLLWVTAPTTLSYSGYFKNVGDMRNTGFEITLNGSPVRTRDLNWNLSLSFSYNSQKVTKLPQENRQLVVDGYQGYQSGNYFIGEGLPLYALYIPLAAGLSDEGKQQWWTTDAAGNQVATTNYSVADKHIVKNFQPMTGSFGTSLTFKGFDLSVQFVYGLGGKDYDMEYAALMTVPLNGMTGYAFHKDVLKAWTPTNTNTDVPRWCYGDQYTGIISDRFLISKSYLSFQNASLGYVLPQKWTRKCFLERVRVYVTADNIWLWTKRKGFDPRISGGFGAYSPMRTISAGVHVQF